MTRDEVIELARKAGGVADDKTIVLWHEELERFAALVAEREREACAKICEQQDVLLDGEWTDDSDYDTGLYRGADLCAAAIRARSTEVK